MDSVHHDGVMSIAFLIVFIVIGAVGAVGVYYAYKDWFEKDKHKNEFWGIVAAFGCVELIFLIITIVFAVKYFKGKSAQKSLDY